MKFDKIKLNSKCNCLTNTTIDTTSEFMRKLKKQQVDEKDFLTHWERGIRPNAEDCQEICTYKGLSINKFLPENENQILQKYKTTFSINPKKGSYCLKFKLNKNTGKVKYTPSQDDKSHYSLYKSDNFNIKEIIILETIKFA